MPDIEFSLSTQVVVVLLSVSIAAAMAVFYYRTTLPPIPTGKKLALLILRLVSFCTLVLLIFQPLLRLVFHSTEPPVLAVLVDNSRSMRLVDGAGDRAAVLRKILSGKYLHGSHHGVRFDYLTFGVHPRSDPELPDDTLALNEDATDIAAALRDLAVQKDNKNIQAALLLTDGVYSLGQNPMYDAERLGIPVYTVGIGDSADQKDVSIVRVTSNDVVFSGTRTPVDVTIRSSGFGGERLQVILLGDGKELDRTSLLLQDGTREYPVHLLYTPEGMGKKTFTVVATSLPGEVSVQNNRLAFSVRVLKSALHVLVLSGAPSPDVSVIRQTISEQSNISVQSLIEKTPAGFYQGRLPPDIMDSVDCLVLIDFPSSATQNTTLDAIGRLLHERAVPLLYICGHRVDLHRLALLGPAIPFTVSSPGTTEETLTPTPDPAQRGNPLLESGNDMTLDSWGRLPPIFRLVGSYKANPEASILVTSSLQHAPTTEPLILTRSAGREKSIAIAGYGIWRWRLMAQGDNTTENLLPAFLHAAIRWLTTPDDLRRFRASPTREIFPEGEAAEFHAQLYSNSAQPLDDARVRVVVRSGGQVAESELQSEGSGRYGGLIEGLREGTYTYRARGEWRGGIAGEDSGSFTVGTMDLEFRDTRMNIGLLRQLAYRTRGAYFSPEEFPRLDSTIRAQNIFTSRQRRTAIELELWHWRYLLASLIVLLSAEWLLRKWYGMV